MIKGTKSVSGYALIKALRRVTCCTISGQNLYLFNERVVWDFAVVSKSHDETIITEFSTQLRWCLGLCMMMDIARLHKE